MRFKDWARLAWHGSAGSVEEMLSVAIAGLHPNADKETMARALMSPYYTAANKCRIGRWLPGRWLERRRLGSAFLQYKQTALSFAFDLFEPRALALRAPAGSLTAQEEELLASLTSGEWDVMGTIFAELGEEVQREGAIASIARALVRNI